MTLKGFVDFHLHHRFFVLVGLVGLIGLGMYVSAISRSMRFRT